MSYTVPDEPNGYDAPPAWFMDGSACPPWCARGHMRTLQEGASIEQASEHVGRSTSNYLPELRSAGDGSVTRPGGGGWKMVNVEAPMRNGIEARTAPVVEFELGNDQPMAARARLTSGKARVLAAQLLRAADQLDLDV